MRCSNDEYRTPYAPVLTIRTSDGPSASAGARRRAQDQRSFSGRIRRAGIHPALLATSAASAARRPQLGEDNELVLREYLGYPSQSVLRRKASLSHEAAIHRHRESGYVG